MSLTRADWTRMGNCQAESAQWLASDQLGSLYEEYKLRGFPGGAVVKNPPANAGDTGWSPGAGRSHMPRSS